MLKSGRLRVTTFHGNLTHLIFVELLPSRIKLQLSSEQTAYRGEDNNCITNSHRLVRFYPTHEP